MNDLLIVGWAAVASSLVGFACGALFRDAQHRRPPLDVVLHLDGKELARTTVRKR